jgi:hypothetical protein
MAVCCETPLAKALRATTNESPGIKSMMNDVAEAIAAVTRDPIGELPRTCRSGHTDVGDLEVSVNARRPFS